MEEPAGPLKPHGFRARLSDTGIQFGVEIQGNLVNQSFGPSYIWGAVGPSMEFFSTSYDPSTGNIGGVPGDIAIAFSMAGSDNPQQGPYLVSWNDNLLQFTYADNGIGLTGNNKEDERFTMGIPLIRDLTRQMNGQMSVNGEGGLTYCFTIPV